MHRKQPNTNLNIDRRHALKYGSAAIKNVFRNTLVWSLACQGIDSLLTTGDGDVQAVIAEQSPINLSQQQQESNVSRTFENKVPDMLC